MSQIRICRLATTDKYEFLTVRVTHAKYQFLTVSKSARDARARCPRVSTRWSTAASSPTR
jgi:hypothetical protein